MESEKKKQKKRKAGEEATDEGAVNDGHAGTMDDPKDFRERKYSVLEALSATGLRAIRYAKEIDGLGTIIANDISESAVENIRRNVEYNGVEQSKVVANHGDATAYMFQHRSGGEKFDVIDLVRKCTGPSCQPKTASDAPTQRTHMDRRARLLIQQFRR